jgi:5'-nucleotidase
LEEDSVPLSASPRRKRRGPLALAALALFGLVIPAGVFAAKPGSPPPKTIQILNVSDWHGQIDPQLLTVGGVSNTPVGGAWSISARLDEDRAAYPSLTLTAGDDFGATPPIAAFFDEIPSVMSQRMMGLQIGTFGNHNFDRGIEHLQEMIDLAGSTDPSLEGEPFTYVSANLANRDANLEGVEDFAIVDVGGLKVGVVGISNPEGPGLVLPGSYGTIIVSDPYSAANRAKAAAKRAGAQIVIAITHMGVRGFDENGQPFGELIDFANDVQFSGTVNGQLVHENRSKGVTYAKTLLTYNFTSKRVTDSSVQIVTPVAPSRTTAELVAAQCPDPNATPVSKYCDAELLEMLSPTRVELAPLLDPKIATSVAVFPRGGNVERRQENALANLVADGMRWYQGADFAFINGGGVRSALPSSYAPLDATLDRSLVDGDPVDLVIGDVYSVLPFTNTVLKRTITGAQLWEALENGVSQIDGAGAGADGRFPQVSGFKFTFNYDLPTGCSGTSGAANWVCVPRRVTTVEFPDGTDIPPDDTVYTLAIPSFTNQGGDSYRVFLNNLQQGENEALDAQVMLDYLEFLGGDGFVELDPADFIEGRITKCGVNHACGG